MTETARQLEARHTPGGGRWWTESWYFDFADSAGLGGYVRIGVYPNQQRAWCWANLVVPGRDGPIIVRDHDVPMPRQSALLARSEGLWCELTLETPMEHWSIGLEAFGVALDSAADAYRGEIGERLAVGLDLEWQTRAVAMPHSMWHSDATYGQVGRVDGEVLLGQERLVFQGTGARVHSWGEIDWWKQDWHWAWIHFDNAPSRHVVAGRGVIAEVEFDGDRLPVSGRYLIDGSPSVDFEVVGCAPVPIDGDGRRTRLPRALCRYTTGDGHTGVGWAEWLQVDGATTAPVPSA